MPLLRPDLHAQVRTIDEGRQVAAGKIGPPPPASLAKKATGRRTPLGAPTVVVGFHRIARFVGHCAEIRKVDVSSCFLRGRRWSSETPFTRSTNGDLLGRLEKGRTSWRHVTNCTGNHCDGNEDLPTDAIRSRSSRFSHGQEVICWGSG